MTYHLVFDATDPKSPRFIELEDSTGHSISAGEWKQRKDGYVELVLPAPDGWQDIATAPRDGEFLAYGSYMYPEDIHPTEYTMVAERTGDEAWPYQTDE